MITTFQALVFLLYVGFLFYKFKKPLPSISDSWYELPIPLNHLFTLFTWSLGFAMVFQGNGETPFFFLSGAGLLFVGTATQFKWTGAHTNIVHYVGALAGIVCALIGLWFENGVYLPTLFWVASVIVLKLTKIKNFTWWVEIFAFACIVIGLYFR